MAGEAEATTWFSETGPVSRARRPKRDAVGLRGTGSPCSFSLRIGMLVDAVSSSAGLRIGRVNDFKCFGGQVTKGARWMPWHQEAMKDVGACDKPRGAGKRAIIRGFPNGVTRPW